MNCAIIVQITQFYAIISYRNYAIYADIMQIIRSHYANKLRNIRRYYTDITQTLHRHYANTLSKINSDYADIMQCFYAIITQHYAKITQNYANSLRTTRKKHYANKFTQALRKYLLFTQ